MSPWLLGAILLTAGLAPLAWVAWREDPVEGTVAAQAAGVVAALILLLLAEAFDRQPFVDLALVLGVMSFVGMLAFLRFFERR